MKLCFHFRLDRQAGVARGAVRGDARGRGGRGGTRGGLSFGHLNTDNAFSVIERSITQHPKLKELKRLSYI